MLISQLSSCRAPRTFNHIMMTYLLQSRHISSGSSSYVRACPAFADRQTLRRWRDASGCLSLVPLSYGDVFGGAPDCRPFYEEALVANRSEIASLFPRGNELGLQTVAVTLRDRFAASIRRMKPFDRACRGGAGSILSELGARNRDCSPERVDAIHRVTAFSPKRRVCASCDADG